MADVSPIFLEKIKTRLQAVESRSYTDVNKQTGALGRYQFVPSYWWKTKDGKTPIQTWAQENGYNDGKPITQDDFLNNTRMQDEFFAHYVEKYMMPFIQKNMDKNKRNLPLDAIGQLYHMNPGSVVEYIRGGEWVIPNQENNMKLDEYLARGEAALQMAGLGHLEMKDVMTPEQIQSRVQEYFQKKEELTKSLDAKKMSPGAYEDNLYRMTREYAQEGLVPEINREIQRRNTEKGNAWNSERAAFQQLYQHLSDTRDTDIVRRYDPKTGNVSLSAANNSGREKLKALAEASGGKLRIHKPMQGTRYQRFAIDFNLDGKGQNGKYLLEGINKFAQLPDGKKLTFEDLANDPGIKKPEENWLKKGLARSDWQDPFFTQKFDFTVPMDAKAGEALIDGSKFDFGTPDYSKPEQKKEEAKKEETTDVAQEEEDTSMDNIMAFYGQQEVPEESGYNADDYKREIPFGAIASGLLGAMGIAAADNDIPKYEQQISAGMQKYIDDLLDISKQGLPPELEAKAKADLADAYTQGLNNMVRASAGNRNLVLGNTGQLDTGRMKAIGDLYVQDWMAKNDAMNKYGEAMKYVTQFNAERDVMNTRMGQQIALQDRQAAGQLGQIGFSNMIEELKAQAERAPGSPYHMLSSQLMIDTMGYDPNRFDDGTGKPGTRSSFEKRRENVNAYNEKSAQLGQMLLGFDENSRKAYSKAWSQTDGTLDQAHRLGQVFSQNPVDSLDMNQMGQALSQNDFNLLIRENNP